MFRIKIAVFKLISNFGIITDLKSNGEIMMKHFLLILFSFFLISTYSADAQFGFIKKLKKKAEEKVEEKVEEEIEESVEEAFEGEEAEETIEEEAEETDDSGNESESEKKTPKAKKKSSKISWSKYDFVPGDIILFEDNLLDEENGEFPSRWDLEEGNVEIAEYEGENVIFCRSESSEIFPLIDEKRYLPEVFTIEFDCYFKEEIYNQIYYITFYSHDKDNDYRRQLGYIEIQPNKVQFKDWDGKYPGAKRTNYIEEPMWRHVSIAFNKRSLKVYLDDTRIINVPNAKIKPESILVEFRLGEDAQTMIKNFRIAKGGKKLYDKVMTDGKIVTRGIKFNVGKATLKPESMGVINKIVKLMKKKTELKFSIEGHTDSDGDDKMNQDLSEKRAQAVKDKFIELGIEESRLKTKGFGESTPVSDNTSPEGKANNRRVEFVPFK